MFFFFFDEWIMMMFELYNKGNILEKNMSYKLHNLQTFYTCKERSLGVMVK